MSSFLCGLQVWKGSSDSGIILIICSGSLLSGSNFKMRPRWPSGNYNYFFPLINTIVHTVMYSYYGLAALGPSVQKYLWWKKYLTTFQMIQFVMVFFYVMTLMVGNCKVSKFIIYLNMFLAGLFLLMFYDYFHNTYLKKRAIQKQKDLDKKNERLRAEKNGIVASEKNDNLHPGKNGIVQNGHTKPIDKKEQ
ncbi:Elongation of very long chain fatty acids protein AAEL008004 [Araneus ventricosus]|uniref:Elongation of very long chain fatty acids protein n=1 Tax=Araneus ventricosus TaxID=182803 RepID=A0A4Y2H3I6_ARAVE|nr:Elongation of very long chain fatty acids protein AAEL008004 [Araneus ventricosus]